MKNKDYEDAMFEIDLSDVEALMENTLPSPELLDFYRRLSNREVVWNTLIGDGIIDISLYILKWNKEDYDIPAEQRKPIKIFINSDGGDPTVIMNLADMIALSKTPVITIGMGRVYSAAGMLLMAGHKRLIFPSTTVLIHDGSGGVRGDTAKILDNLEFQRQYEERYCAFVVEHTKISEKVMKQNYRRDWFMFSEEAVSYGVADKIITDIEEIM